MKNHPLVQKILRLLLILFCVQVLYIFVLRWVDPPVTVTQLVSLAKGHGLKRDYVSYKQMAPHAALAVIASEDQRFPDHNGFDWISIQKAYSHNQKNPKRVRGGSTISQQVAKNVFLWQGRDWIRKGLEVYFTFMIESLWPKERILEMYLNVVEMGPGIFGIEAAAQAYFKKSARNLTPREAAQIAAVLPNPKRYGKRPYPAIVAKRTEHIARQMQFIAGYQSVKQILPVNKPRHKK